MKKLNLILSFICLFNFYNYGQRTLPTIENFEYPVDNLPTEGTDWSIFVDLVNNIGNDTAKIISGNLIYSNYPMPASGSRLSIEPVENGPMTISILNFKAVNNPGDKIYASFLLQVLSRGELNTDGPRLFGFSNSSLAGWSHLSVSVRLRVDVVNGGFNIGLTKGANEPIWSPATFTFGSDPILLVLSYEFVAGANTNDTARLWINPDLTGPEPPPTIKAPGTIFNGDDPDSLCYFFVRAKEPPVGSIDAIRIATAWNEAPLPVELSDFSVKVNGSAIQLNWKTETEVNDYGFDIQRSEAFAQDNKWETIGFVYGNGNSNSPHFYSFTDNEPSSGKHFYRLKQIDNDGKFNYSKSIEVDLGLPDGFQLSQNYPNPFNPVTKIRYQLPKESKITIKLYDILGSEVMELVNEQREAGVYELEFKASNLPSGAYIYRMFTGDFNQAKKMMIMK